MIKHIIIILCMVVSVQAQDVSWAVNKWKCEPLTLSNVAQAIVDLQIENPVIVFKQTIKESGWKNKKTEYKSKLATVGNNLFGMRKAKRRLTTALDKVYFGHATYSNWIYSVLDYKYWQMFKPKKKNENYRKYLQRRKYNGNGKYTDGLDYIKLPKKLIEIFESIDYDNKCKINNNFIGGIYTNSALLLSDFSRTENKNCLCGQRDRRHDDTIRNAVSGTNHNSGQGKNYLQGNRNPGEPYYFGHDYRNKALHCDIRYDCSRYFQYQI